MRISPVKSRAATATTVAVRAVVRAAGRVRRRAIAGAAGRVAMIAAGVLRVRVAGRGNRAVSEARGISVMIADFATSATSVRRSPRHRVFPW